MVSLEAELSLPIAIEFAPVVLEFEPKAMEFSLVVFELLPKAIELLPLASAFSPNVILPSTPILAGIKILSGLTFEKSFLSRNSFLFGYGRKTCNNVPSLPIV